MVNISLSRLVFALLTSTIFPFAFATPWALGSSSPAGYSSIRPRDEKDGRGPFCEFYEIAREHPELDPYFRIKIRVAITEDECNAARSPGEYLALFGRYAGKPTRALPTMYFKESGICILPFVSTSPPDWFKLAVDCEMKPGLATEGCTSLYNDQIREARFDQSWPHYPPDHSIFDGHRFPKFPTG